MLVVAALLNGCGSGASAATQAGVTLNSFSIKLDQASLPAGMVRFNATNAANVKHELVLLRTDAPDDKLPVSADGEASENGKVGEIEEFAGPNVTRSHTFALTSGHYVLICNISGHYQQGMHVGFSVQ
jgi:uncharacterized cupredoxin-like copper-binding protein